MGEPSYGKSLPGYRLLRSRVRIPRGHRLILVVDVPYSDSFEGIIVGDCNAQFVIPRYLPFLLSFLSFLYTLETPRLRL